MDRKDTVIEWDAEMEGDEHCILDGSLTDVWLAEKRLFELAAGT
jgi:hypothetical protein